MAAITSVGNGRWVADAATVWSSGTAPTSADTVTISHSTTVTLDDLGCVAFSVTMQGGGVGQVGGKLQASQVASSRLILENGIVNNTVESVVGSTRNPTIDLDVSAVPTINCEIALNNAATTGTATTIRSTANFQLKGANRKRWTTSAALTGNSTTSVVVADATGWVVGDILIFATTQAYDTAESFLTSGASWSGGYLTVTASSTISSKLFPGSQFYWSSVQANLLGNQTVYDVPTGTTFRIAMADPTVTDAAGTGYYAPRTDEVTIDTITPGAGTTATITWTDGLGTGGAVAFDHADGCIVGNYTSNLILRGATAVTSLHGGTGALANAYATSQSQVIDNVQFKWLNGTATYSYQGALSFLTPIGGWSSVSNNAFYHCGGAGMWAQQTVGLSFTRTSNIHYSSRAYQAYSFSGIPSDFGTDEDVVIMRCTTGAVFSTPGASLLRPKFSGFHVIVGTSAYNSISPNAVGMTITDGDFWSNAGVTGCSQSSLAPFAFNNCTFGTKYSGAINGRFYGFSTTFAQDNQVTFNNCSIDLASSVIRGLVSLSGNSFIAYYNLNDDTAVQQLFTRQSDTVPAIQRDYATSPQIFTRSTSSMLFTSTRSFPITQSTQILALNGIAVTIIVYMMTDINYGASTLPTIALSGLGVSASTTFVETSTGSASIASTGSNSFTRASGSFVTDGFAAGDSVYVEGFASNNGTFTVTAVATGTLTVAEATTVEAAAGSRRITKWYKATITGTQSSGADGNITLTLTSQSSNSGAKAWFSGIPFAPYISRARHYGYRYNETVPTLTTNLSVSANEATAQAYTGIDVTWDPSQSDTQITDDVTFQELYDYTQAWGALNVEDALPFTGAGAAGNVTLFAAGDVTIDTTKVINGQGGISMGAFTLTSEFASGADPAYTYTGGTWSQLTTVPTFNGGTLAMGEEGTYVFAAVDTIITFAPSAAAVTYVLGGGTFEGELDLRNTSATREITVELPAGTSYTTANNTGDTITVVTPSVYQSVTINSLIANSRVRIYDVTSATELYNDVVAGTSHTWTDPSPASGTREITLRVTNCITTTAYLMVDAAIGTCGTTEPSNAITYVAAQELDTTYNSNGIDGPAIYATSGITFTDAATDLVVCNIAGGTVSWPTIYACFVYWLYTSAGIDDDVTYISAPDTANYLLTAMKVRNTNATPLTITDGYGRSATTGLVADIIDVAGSTGNIYPEPDHVIPYSSGAEATVAIVQSGLTAQGYTTTRGPYLDKLPHIQNGVNALQ